MVSLPTPDEIRTKGLRDLELGLIQAGVDVPATQEGSEYHILWTSIANQLALLSYGPLQRHYLNTSELTATGQALEDIRIASGLEEVLPTGATGTILPVLSVSSVTFPDELEFTLDRSGLQGVVDGSQTITPGGLLTVRMVDTGAQTNAEAGEAITFGTPPNNVATRGTVGPDGLTGGTDAESDERKRQRILNRRRNVGGQCSWGSAIELAERATGAVQKAFCYPAIVGPSSAKVVVVKAMQLDRSLPLDFSRELGESSLNLIRGEILSTFPIGDETSVQSAEDELFDCSLLLTLTDPQKGGWINSAPWPALVPGDNGRVTVTSTSANNIITVSAGTATAPQVGKSVAWWSPAKRQFLVAKIITQSGTAGAWVLTLDRPLVIGDSTVAEDDFISPGANRMSLYGEAFLQRCQLLGPGENSEDPYRAPRANRKPTQAEWNSDIGAAFLKDVTKDESILDYAWSYRSLNTPTIPADEEDAPSVLVPRHFGVYAL